MRIVVDTNVIASAIFFGGKPLQLVKLILDGKIEAAASPKIISEYYDTVNYLLEKYNGKDLNVPLLQIVSQMIIFGDTDHVHICRDSDDDKFLSCAEDSNSIYVVSGDKDLLTLENYKEIKIVTVSDFFEKIKN